MGSKLFFKLPWIKWLICLWIKCCLDQMSWSSNCRTITCRWITCSWISCRWISCRWITCRWISCRWIKCRGLIFVILNFTSIREVMIQYYVESTLAWRECLSWRLIFRLGTIFIQNIEVSKTLTYSRIFLLFNYLHEKL